jgi:predicted RNase H-like HicB family nuclease
MKYKNTLQKGSVRFIIFRDGDNWYGVCLDFNIVEAGDTPQEATLLLSEAIEGYLESARKIKARPYILNQKPDPEYEEMWDKIEEKKSLSKEVFSFGSFNITSRAFASV